MHVLVLTEGFPYPLTSGRLRQFHFIHELARMHRITLVSTVPPGHPPQHAAVLTGVVERVETIPSRRLGPQLAVKLWSVVDHTLAITPSRTTAELSRRVAALHAADPFDVVLDARLAVPLHTLLPGVPVVTDICDTTSASFRAQLRYSPFHARPKILAKYLEARRAEATMAASSDHILFASERDREALLDDLGVLPPSSVLPNGVDLGYWRRSTRARPRDTIVFAGAMPYAPNEDAARFLINEIMPVIRRVRSDVRLKIVGRDPSPHLVAAADTTPWIEVTGYVDDMRPHLEWATVVLAPLRFGTGIQNKVLEAMAMEVPVVTTPGAAAGLFDRDDPSAPPLVVATDVAAFAAAGIAILNEADVDPSPHATGRSWVSERFRWDVVGAHLDAILQLTHTQTRGARDEDRGGGDR